MSFRDWLSHPPIGVGIAVAALLALAGLNNHYYDTGRAERPATYEQRQTQPITAAGTLTQGPSTESNAARQEERAERDLQAQEQMAKWAFWLFIITCLGVVLLAATLHETWKAGQSAAEIFTQTKRQADLAEQSYKRLERPYLFIEFATTSRLREVAPEGTASLKYTFVNYGKLPAVLRSIAILLQDNPTLPLRVPLAIDDRTYGVIAPGGKAPKIREVFVTNGTPGRRYDNIDAKQLILHGYVAYEDPTGAYHHDSFCMRGIDGGTGFEIDGGEQYNSRKTTYPKPGPE